METKRLEQYRNLKAKHPDAVLLFRNKAVGVDDRETYTSYEEDAQRVADICGLSLSMHELGHIYTTFEWQWLDVYIPKLIRSGCRVAICDQIEPPRKKRSINSLEQPKGNV